MKKMKSILMAVALVCAFAANAAAQSTLVPGHKKADKDGNGSADAGVLVNSQSRYAIEWVSGGITYECTYTVIARGDFNNDPYLNSGWVMNNIRCTGGGSTGAYHYVIVHETDPRYTGDPYWAEWITWEYAVLTESGLGNVVKNGR